MGAITGESNVKGSELGRIDIFPSFSLVEMKYELDNKTRKRIGQARLAGRALNISRDNGPRKRQKSAGTAGTAGAADNPELRKYRADKKFGEERRKARQQAQERAQQRKKKGKKSRH